MRKFKFFQQLIQWILPADIKKNPILLANSALHEIHKGERCFILATGPSISTQNLLPLKDEICISINMFYLNHDYDAIKPRYHLVSGIAPHPKITDKLGRLWFSEIEKKVKADYLLLNYLDRPFVERNIFFPSKKVFYFDFSMPLEEQPLEIIDAATSLYASQTASMMAIQLAIYMGFSKIYLLGMDHDGILRYTKRLPMHFYKPQDSIFEKQKIHDGDNLDWETEFHNQWILWKQYKILKKYTDLHKIKIINVTPKSLLDVFERADYDSIVGDKK